MFQINFAYTCFIPILKCLPTTMKLTFAATLLALVGGILLSFGVKSRYRTVNIIFSILNSFLKGIPILVFLYVFNDSVDDIMTWLSYAFGFAYDIRHSPTFAFAVLAMALSYAPYMCDMITSAYDTIPKGQREACEAFGFTQWQMMRRILIPQMTVIALPNFGNHFVNLLKATSLTCMVTIMEMMGAARNFATLNQRFLETYSVCALLYWGVFLIFEQVFRILEKKTGRYLGTALAAKKRRRKLFRMTKASDEELGQGERVKA
jgi:ABC-type amino acid transport system permease subunit